MSRIERGRVLMLSCALMAGGVVLAGCDSVKKVGSSVGSTVTGWLPGQTVDGLESDIDNHFLALEGSQQDARSEVEEAYAAMEKLANAPAEEIDAYYAEYAKASDKMRSQFKAYEQKIDELEAKVDAELDAMSEKIGDEGNALAQEAFDNIVKENKASSKAVFDQARGITTRLSPLADNMDTRALAIKSNVTEGSTGVAKLNLSKAKAEVDTVLEEFDEGAEEIEKAVDESTAT